MKNYLLMLLSAVIITLAACISCSKQHHEQQIIEPVESDSIEQYEEWVPTVYDILSEREEIRYMRMIDSVYLQIPEPILIHMLTVKGTTISQLEIVEEYLNNKQYYHDTILNAINIHKNFIPDALPKKAKIDEPLQALDPLN